MPLDVPPSLQLWLPPTSSIIRPAPGDAAIVRKTRREHRATFPFPVFCPSGAVAISAIVQQASASSLGTTITWPTVAAGDIAVLHDYTYNVGTPTAVTPSGFTNMCNVAGTTNGVQARSMTSFKRCTGTESGLLTGMASNLGVAPKAMVTFRTTPTTVSATGGSGQNGAITDGNPSPIVVAASGGAAPLIAIGAYFCDGVVNPRTFSPTKDGEISFNSNSQYIAWKFYLTSPADVTIDMDDEGTGMCVQGFYVALT